MNIKLLFLTNHLTGSNVVLLPGFEHLGCACLYTRLAIQQILSQYKNRFSVLLNPVFKTFLKSLGVYLCRLLSTPFPFHLCYLLEDGTREKLTVEFMAHKRSDQSVCHFIFCQRRLHSHNITVNSDSFQVVLQTFITKGVFIYLRIPLQLIV